MKNKGKTVFKVFLATAALLLVINAGYHIGANIESKETNPANVPGKKPPIIPKNVPEKHVLADFYYWYDLPSGAHSTSLTDHPTDAASYNNPAWFKKQLLDMKDAGVDTALLVYWSKYEPAYLDGLHNLAAAREDLASSNQNIPKIGLFFDTGIFGRVPKEDKNLLTDQGKSNFYAIIKEFFQNIPQKDWALVENRPVIWLWGNYFDILFDQSSFDYVYENFQRDFGVRPYIVREETWNYPKKSGFFIPSKPDFTKPIVTDDVYRWGAALNGEQDAGGNVVSVGPGYDERQLPASDRSGRFTLRDDGNYYSQNFQKALDAQKPLINIETWNEYHEASDIAQSKEYSRKYIDLTRLFVNKFLAK